MTDMNFLLVVFFIGSFENLLVRYELNNGGFKSMTYRLLKIVLSFT